MYTIGIDVGGTNLKAGLVNDRFEIEATAKMPLRWESAEKFADDLVSLAKAAAAEKGVALDEIGCIGIGVPGQVDNKKGLIVKTVNIPIRDLPIAEMMRKQWDVPVYLGNDADCAALGEFYHYEDRDIENLILVTLGTGVGTGVILNGRIHRGVNGCAGEGGHIVIVAGGEQCTCGRRGCCEAYCSATALIRDTKRMMEAHPDSKMWEVGDISEVNGKTAFDYLETDVYAREVVESYIDSLACTLTNFANIFRPEVILLGGGVCAQGDRLTKPLQEKINAEIFAGDKGPSVPVLIAKLGNSAGLLGAAALLMD
jgi:glucokinase